jgi:hypothetical protein
MRGFRSLLLPVFLAGIVSAVDYTANVLSVDLYADESMQTQVSSTSDFDTSEVNPELGYPVLYVKIKLNTAVPFLTNGMFQGTPRPTIAQCIAVSSAGGSPAPCEIDESFTQSTGGSPLNLVSGLSDTWLFRYILRGRASGYKIIAPQNNNNYYYSNGGNSVTVSSSSSTTAEFSLAPVEPLSVTVDTSGLTFVPDTQPPTVSLDVTGSYAKVQVKYPVDIAYLSCYYMILDGFYCNSLSEASLDQQPISDPNSGSMGYLSLSTGDSYSHDFSFTGTVEEIRIRFKLVNGVDPDDIGVVIISPNGNKYGIYGGTDVDMEGLSASQNTPWSQDDTAMMRHEIIPIHEYASGTWSVIFFHANSQQSSAVSMNNAEVTMVTFDYCSGCANDKRYFQAQVNLAADPYAESIRIEVFDANYPVYTTPTLAANTEVYQYDALSQYTHPWTDSLYASKVDDGDVSPIVAWSTGPIVGFLGNFYQYQPESDSQPAHLADLGFSAYPSPIVATCDGSVLVYSSRYRLIRKVEVDTNVVTTIAGNGNLYGSDQGNNGGNTSPANAREVSLGSVVAMELDPNSCNIILSEHGTKGLRILYLDSNDQWQIRWATGSAPTQALCELSSYSPTCKYSDLHPATGSRYPVDGDASTFTLLDVPSPMAWDSKINRLLFFDGMLLREATFTYETIDGVSVSVINAVETLTSSSVDADKHYFADGNDTTATFPIRQGFTMSSFTRNDQSFLLTVCPRSGRLREIEFDADGYVVEVNTVVGPESEGNVYAMSDNDIYTDYSIDNYMYLSAEDLFLAGMGSAGRLSAVTAIISVSEDTWIAFGAQTRYPSGNTGSYGSDTNGGTGTAQDNAKENGGYFAQPIVIYYHATENKYSVQLMQSNFEAGDPTPFSFIGSAIESQSVLGITRTSSGEVWVASRYMQSFFDSRQEVLVSNRRRVEALDAEGVSARRTTLNPVDLATRTRDFNTWMGESALPHDFVSNFRLEGDPCIVDPMAHFCVKTGDNFPEVCINNNHQWRQFYDSYTSPHIFSNPITSWQDYFPDFSTSDMEAPISQSTLWKLQPQSAPLSWRITLQSASENDIANAPGSWELRDVRSAATATVNDELVIAGGFGGDGDVTVLSSTGSGGYAFETFPNVLTFWREYAAAAVRPSTGKVYVLYGLEYTASGWAMPLTVDILTKDSNGVSLSSSLTPSPLPGMPHFGRAAFTAIHSTWMEEEVIFLVGGLLFSCTGISTDDVCVSPMLHPARNALSILFLGNDTITHHFDSDPLALPNGVIFPAAVNRPVTNELIAFGGMSSSENDMLTLTTSGNALEVSPGIVAMFSARPGLAVMYTLSEQHQQWMAPMHPRG